MVAQLILKVDKNLNILQTLRFVELSVGQSVSWQD